MNDVAQQHAGDGPVRHAHAGVAGDDEDILVVVRIRSDEAEAVDRLEHLARPPVCHDAHHRESLARPGFERGPASLGVVGLTDLVILTPDDQHLALGQRVHAHVVVGIGRVPVERARRAAAQRGADRVGDVRVLARVHEDSADERCVGGHDHGVAHHDSRGGAHARGAPAGHTVGAGAAVDAAAAPLDRPHEAAQILQHVELGLPWKSQRRSRVEAVERRAGDERDVGETGVVRGAKLLAQQVGRLAWRGKQIPVEPLEIARDRLRGDDGLETIDGRGVTLRGQPRAVDAVNPRDVHVQIVDRVRQVRRRAAALAAADRAVIEHEHAAAFEREMIGE